MKVIIDYRPGIQSDTADNVVRTAFAHISHKIYIRSINAPDQGKNSYSKFGFDNYSQASSHSNFQHNLYNSPFNLSNNNRNSGFGYDDYSQASSRSNSQHHLYNSPFSSFNNNRNPETQFNHNTVVQITVEFDISSLRFDEDYEEQIAIIEEAKRSIKDAIGLRSYLSFKQFEDMPNYDQLKILHPKRTTNPPSSQSKPFDSYSEFNSHPLHDFHSFTPFHPNQIYQSVSMSSPIQVNGNMHDQLVKQLKLTAANINPEITESFFKAIDQRQYGQAIRRACTTTNQIGYDLITIMLSYQKFLPIDVNETASNSKDTAIHYAARNKLIELVDLLIANGADASTLDNNGKSVNDYLNDAIKTSQPQ